MAPPKAAIKTLIPGKNHLKRQSKGEETTENEHSDNDFEEITLAHGNENEYVGEVMSPKGNNL
jgi:hypothetical protein